MGCFTVLQPCCTIESNGACGWPLLPMWTRISPRSALQKVSKQKYREATHLILLTLSLPSLSRETGITAVQGSSRSHSSGNQHGRIIHIRPTNVNLDKSC